MDLVLVSLRPPSGAVRSADPETVADILWANAETIDGLEHVRAAPGALGGLLRLALFLAPRSSRSAEDAAVELCRRAILASPLLAGFGIDASACALTGLSEVLDRGL